MAVRIETNAEPIPGYTLIERLGGGGFGEVWKAQAPGGLFKAIKFVYGDLQSIDDDDGARAEQELKALSRVKSVHHPFILSLERYDIIGGQLIIVMELADRTIYDRFKECRSQGLPGIPRDELLNYMEETAEALDLMNTQYQLQHLDIKPQNLFLVFNHVKVADFGLVKDLEGMSATVTGGVTPAYAAPETFDGKISRFSDLYSLAIVYQELLSGHRPYAGTTLRQLVLQHLQGTPDLNSLPLGDRPVVARALAKLPTERYPSCVDFVKALRAASRPSAPKAVPDSDAPGEPRPQAPTDDTEPATLAGVRLGRDRNNGFRFLPLQDSEEGGNTGSIRNGKKHPATSEETTSKNILVHGTAGQLVPVDDTGVLVPALVIGLGQMGLTTLRQFRRTLSEQFHAADSLGHVRFLHLDTDVDAVQNATSGDPAEALHVNEVLPTRLHRPSHYLRVREGKAPVESWLNSKVLYRISKQQKGATLRALGRLALVDNYRSIVRRLETELQACLDPEAMNAAAGATGSRFRTISPRVYIVTSLAGSTGSGMFLDLAYLARHLLKKMGYAPEVIGVLLVPPAEAAPASVPGLANTCAALTELSHFSYPDSVFSARYDVEPSAAKGFQHQGPAFQRCLLVPGKRERNETGPGVAARIGHALFCDLFTPLGRNAEESRRERWGGLDPQNTTFHAFGTHRVLWPRRQLLRQAGKRLCRRLVDHWMAKDASSLTEEVAKWSQEQWEAHGLRLENLITRYQEQAEQLLKQSPEKLFASVIGPLTSALAPAPGKPQEPLNLGPVVQVLDQLEKILGLPDDCRPQGLGVSSEASLIERALTETGTAIAQVAEQTLAELVVRLMEEPAYRLAGAEEAIRQFSTLVEQALRSQETLARELHDRTGALYQRLQKIVEQTNGSAPSQSTPFWRAAFTRKAPQVNANIGQEIADLVRCYAKARYQSLVLSRITALYVSLRGLLSDQIREIGFCRHRLTELSSLLEPPPQAFAEAAKNAPFADKVLLPPACLVLDDAVKALNDQVTPEHLCSFDRQVQELLRKQFRALVNVCLASSTVIKTLAPAMLEEAETFLQGRLESSNVVDMFLAQFAEDQGRANHLEDELKSAFDGAAPELARMAAEKEVSLIAIPAGARGEPLLEPLRQAFPHSRIVTTDLTDEIIFYREDPHLLLQDLDQLGPLAQEAYRQRSVRDPDSVHTRNDIVEWNAAAFAH